VGISGKKNSRLRHGFSYRSATGGKGQRTGPLPNVRAGKIGTGGSKQKANWTKCVRSDRLKSKRTMGGKGKAAKEKHLVHPY